jgi:polyferredoxin
VALAAVFLVAGFFAGAFFAAVFLVAGFLEEVVFLVVVFFAMIILLQIKNEKVKVRKRRNSALSHFSFFPFHLLSLHTEAFYFYIAALYVAYPITEVRYKIPVSGTFALPGAFALPALPSF